MSSDSKIEWTDATWNPIAGCSIVSPGCHNCYAMRMAARLQGRIKGYDGVVADGRWTGRVNPIESRLAEPFRWRRPRMVFPCSMSDLFHPDVPFEFILRVVAVMVLTPKHTYQILTKRPDRMEKFWRWLRAGDLDNAISEYANARRSGIRAAVERWNRLDPIYHLPYAPEKNIWLGTSVEDQKRADERLPHLLKCPAAVRFLSVEPMLGPVDFANVGGRSDVVSAWGKRVLSGIHWVIVGGESGPGARPMDPEWARSIRDQCQEAGVAFFMKQIDKKQPIPDDLMIREFPDER